MVFHARAMKSGVTAPAGKRYRAEIAGSPVKAEVHFQVPQATGETTSGIRVAHRSAVGAGLLPDAMPALPPITPATGARGHAAGRRLAAPTPPEGTSRRSRSAA
jgi:hypothetical protein